MNLYIYMCVCVCVCVCEPDSSEWLVSPRNNPISPFPLCYVSPEEYLSRWRGSSFSLVPHHSLMYFSHSHFSKPSSLPLIPYLSTSLSRTIMMIGRFFRWVGPPWNRFLSRWDSFFWIDVIVLKLAPAVNWFSTSDFPQGTTMPSIIRPRHVASFWAGTVFKPLLNSGPLVYWNWGVGPLCQAYTLDWA